MRIAAFVAAVYLLNAALNGLLLTWLIHDPDPDQLSELERSLVKGDDGTAWFVVKRALLWPRDEAKLWRITLRKLSS